MIEKRNGRPTLAEQCGIEKQLWPYFEQRYKSQITANETGINIKTVRKYFRIWTGKYLSVQGSEFFKNCRMSNGRTILQVDAIILDLKKQSDKLYAAIESPGPISDKRWMLGEYRKTQELLSKLYMEKNDLENTPTADIVINTRVNEIFKKDVELDHVAY